MNLLTTLDLCWLHYYVMFDDLSEINKKIKKKTENRFTDNFRSMSTSLSCLVDDLSEINKKESESENKFIDNIRSMLTSLSCLLDDLSEINRKISLIELIEKFPITYHLWNKDHNKFMLLLRKGIYSYEYMDSWQRFDEESLPDKEYFYSELNNEGITDEEYEHAQKVWKVFKIKNLGMYHDLYVQGDTSLLAEVFEILEINA